MSDVKAFAEKVEKVLNRVVDAMHTDTSERRALQDLKEEAGDIASGVEYEDVGHVFDGIDVELRR